SFLFSPPLPLDKSRNEYILILDNSITCLQGRVRFPTGGKSPRAGESSHNSLGCLLGFSADAVVGESRRYTTSPSIPLLGFDEKSGATSTRALSDNSHG
ncbi:MAG: hypothetical protein J6Y19_06630, partial [Kiritimatiellae bacterium]|nr:hypothetical protein [Kiritimatiellia bacterium]